MNTGDPAKRRAAFAGGGRVDRQAIQQTMEAIFSEPHGNHKPAPERPVRVEQKISKPSLSRRTTEQKIPLGILQDLLIERPARRNLDSLVLSKELRTSVERFLNEYAHAPLLRSKSLEPRHTALLIGPPGNGKTSLAEAIAAETGLPFLTVRYDGLVDSYLGETATRLRKVMDFAASGPCVLFFDEFDALGKERGDKQESGEIKRVVSSLLVQIDALPSQCIVVCATNHAELLDRAVWRRFELRLVVPLPGQKELAEWFGQFEGAVGEDLTSFRHKFLDCMDGQSFSEIEAFGLDLRRDVVISGGSLRVQDIIDRALTEWEVRAKMNRNFGICDDRPSDYSSQERNTTR